MDFFWWQVGHSNFQSGGIAFPVQSMFHVCAVGTVVLLHSPSLVGGRTYGVHKLFESSRYKYKRERHIMLSTLYAPCCCSGVPKSAPRRFLPTPSLRNQTEDNGTSVDSETNRIALEVVVLPNNKWSGTSLILLSSDSCHKLTGISWLVMVFFVKTCCLGAC